MTLGLAVLWNPEKAVCEICSEKSCVRKFALNGHMRPMCKPCWRSTIEEYNMSDGSWINEVGKQWRDDAPISLEFERCGDEHEPHSLMN